MEKYPDCWSLVSGFLDFNETARECVIRETWEELGLNLLQFGELSDQPVYVDTVPNKVLAISPLSSAIYSLAQGLAYSFLDAIA